MLAADTSARRSPVDNAIKGTIAVPTQSIPDWGPGEYGRPNGPAAPSLMGQLDMQVELAMKQTELLAQRLVPVRVDLDEAAEDTVSRRPANGLDALILRLAEVNNRLGHLYESIRL